MVGHSAKRPFPRLTYGALKEQGKVVFAVDPSTDEVDGDPTCADLDSLPGAVDAVVIEVPQGESAQWVRKAAALGVRDVWLHMNTASEEALAVARDANLRLRHGTCAVMYLKQGFTYHSIHRWVNRLRGKY